MEVDDPSGYIECPGPVVRKLVYTAIANGPGADGFRLQAMGHSETSLSYPRVGGERMATILCVREGREQWGYTTGASITRKMALTWTTGMLVAFKTRTLFDAALEPHKRANARLLVAETPAPQGDAPAVQLQGLSRIVVAPLSQAFIKLFLDNVDTAVDMQTLSTREHACILGGWFGIDAMDALLAKLTTNARAVWNAHGGLQSRNTYPAPPATQDLEDARARLKDWLPEGHADLLFVRDERELRAALLVEWALVVLRYALPWGARCLVCGRNDKGNRRCKRCLCVFYCGRSCQESHWAEHKAVCIPVDKTGSAPLDALVTRV